MKKARREGSPESRRSRPVSKPLGGSEVPAFWPSGRLDFEGVAKVRNPVQVSGTGTGVRRAGNPLVFRTGRLHLVGLGIMAVPHCEREEARPNANQAGGDLNVAVRRNATWTATRIKRQRENQEADLSLVGQRGARQG